MFDFNHLADFVSLPLGAYQSGFIGAFCVRDAAALNKSNVLKEAKNPNSCAELG